MSTNQELNMAKLAGAEQSTEPSSASTTKREREKQTYTLCGLKADPSFEIRKAWIKRRFVDVDGEQAATFGFWYTLLSVKPQIGTSLGELEALKTPVQVTITTANGSSVPATFHGAH